MHLESKQIGNFKILTFSGEIKNISGSFKSIIMNHISELDRNIAIDLSAISFIDSAGFGTLFNIAYQFKKRNGKVIIFCPNKDIKELLNIVRFNTFAEIFSDQVSFKNYLETAQE